MTAIPIALPIRDIKRICRKNRVRELSLFGSALTARFRPDSDLDFLVEFDPDAQVGFLALAKLQRELSVATRRTVDLVPKGSLKPQIRDRVLKAATIVYAQR